MEFTLHGRRDGRSFTAAEEEDERGGGGHPFLPALSSSSSSAIVLHWPEGSHESTEGEQPPPLLPAAAVEKEHMFEKVVTPSDVGKLNRLVIPKQHAEKYFPLDASTHDKGLLLNFEDRNGKPWRFRYSYWNSSQSYVMTKGWSRFVKEKRLDAGDTVSFARGAGEAVRDRLFIDWKRRPDPHLDPPAYLRIPAGRFPYSAHSPSSSISSSAAHHHHPYLSFSRSSAAPWAAGRIFVPHTPAPAAPHSANYFYFRSSSAASPAPQRGPQHNSSPPNTPMVLDSVPVAHGKAAASPKHFRLFGVNLDLQPADDTVGLLKLQLRAPLPAPELRLGRGIGSSSAASSSSSSRGAKDDEHSNSPP